MANIAAVLCAAVHEATAFVVCLCTSKCMSQEIAALHQLDRLWCDASAAFGGCSATTCPVCAGKAAL